MSGLNVQGGFSSALKQAAAPASRSQPPFSQQEQQQQYAATERAATAAASRPPVPATATAHNEAQVVSLAPPLQEEIAAAQAEPRWVVDAAAAEPAAEQPAAEQGAALEPEVHSMQGVTLFTREVEPAATVAPGTATAAASPGAQAAATAATAAPEPAKKKFVPRERAVPSTSIGRAVGFAGLGASLLWGTVSESVSRRLGGGGGAKAAHPSSAFITEQNAERLANALCRMRGAALKIGQMLSIQDENVLPPQFSAALERVRAGADVMPRRQLEKARGTIVSESADGCRWTPWLSHIPLSIPHSSASLTCPQVLVSELGPDWRDKLADFDYSPMAAASIGQVHLARLHNGREVCMKIQYPGERGGGLQVGGGSMTIM